MIPATIRVTFFANLAAMLKREEKLTPQQLVQQISEMVSSEKARLPLLKLGGFGDKRSERNCLRHDENVWCVSGAIGDYDGEIITFDEAVALVRKAGLFAIVYTSPSHTPDKPHLRVLAPSSRDWPPSKHEQLIGRLNGIFGGALAGESFTLSQSYYFGRVVGAVEYKVELIEGECIDLLDLPEMGKPKGNGFDASPGEKTHNRQRGDIRDICAALETISNDGPKDWDWWNTVALATWGASGGMEPGFVAFNMWSAKNKCYDAVHTRERWDHITKHPPTKSGYGSLDDWAKKADPNWLRPSSIFTVGGGETREGFDANPDTNPDTDNTSTENDDWDKFNTRDSSTNGASKPRLITATPFVWEDPAFLPRRQFLYGRHLIRGYCSCTIAPGAMGKSSLITAEALAMATGKPLLDDQPKGKLRVWHINLEDPVDELKRRFAAAALHYEIDGMDIEDRLFLDSGRSVNLVIASESRNGIMIAVPLIEALKAEILEKKIDVLQVDPFVACHSVSENDNGKIAAVAREWAMIAEATNCAIELVHHARKLSNGQQVFSVEDARGASALIAAVRSARVINGMTKAEAEEARVENHTSYFNVSNGKSNLVPRSDKVTWRHLVGVRLGNGETRFDVEGDTVAVVEAWSWPDPFDDVSVEEAKEVQKRIAAGEWRESPQSTTWAGIAIAEVLCLDVTQKAVKSRVIAALKGWLASGALRAATKEDKHRKPKRFIVVGQWIT